MLKTPIDLAVVNATLSTAYEGAYNSAKPQWHKIAMEIPFGAAGLVLGWLGQAPQMREFIDERQVKDIEEYAYRVEPKVYESTVGVKISELNDGLIASNAKVVAAMGEAAALHPDELVYGALPANELCFDKKNFFSNEHPGFDKNGAPTTYSNDIEGSGPAWYILKVDSVIKPVGFGVRDGEGYQLTTLDSAQHYNAFKYDRYEFGVRARVGVIYGPWQYALRSKAELTKANVEAAIAQMGTYRGNSGRPLTNDPTVIVFGPELEAAARNLFATERLANGGSNTMFNRLEMIKSKYV